MVGPDYVVTKLKTGMRRTTGKNHGKRHETYGEATEKLCSATEMWVAAERAVRTAASNLQTAEDDVSEVEAEMRKLIAGFARRGDLWTSRDAPADINSCIFKFTTK